MSGPGGRRESASRPWVFSRPFRGRTQVKRASEFIAEIQSGWVVVSGMNLQGRLRASRFSNLATLAVVS